MQVLAIPDSKPTWVLVREEVILLGAANADYGQVPFNRGC